MTTPTRSPSITADQRAGARLAFLGGARILREAATAPSRAERIALWRNRRAQMAARTQAVRGRSCHEDRS